MLYSMTGHGEAHLREDGVAVSVELRSINSRYLKLSIRTGDSFNALEPQIEAVVRKYVRRGTVQLNLRVVREATADDYMLNETVLSSYLEQLKAIRQRLSIDDRITLEELLTLPGVVVDRGSSKVAAETDWPLIERALTDALKTLDTMRLDEGRHMADDLRANCDAIAAELEQIEALAPRVSEGYRERFTERLNKLLEQYDVQVAPADVVREVGTFAERTDISEETVRMRSHIKQFHTIMKGQESNGRKLEFLTQEMFRETNTIGSKANDAAIARHVIEIKAAIERMREMIQNVE